MPQYFEKSDEELIALLCAEWSEQEKALSILFKGDYLKKATIGVMTASGASKQDAEEAFAEGSRIFVENILKRQYRGDSKPITYFIKICFNVWIDKKRGAYQKRMGFVADAVELDKMHFDTPEYHFDLSVLKTTLQDLLRFVKEKCRDILWLSALDYSMAEIADEMGLKEERAAIHLAYRCREKLRKKIGESPGLNNFFKSFLP